MTFFFSSRFLTEEMASFLVCGGRALFFALLVTQNFMLAAYPATYKGDCCCCCFTGSISHHLARPRAV